MVKKRSKVLVAVGVGMGVLLLLVSALLLGPPVPYKFLEGAVYKGTTIHKYGKGVASGAAGRTSAVKKYKVERPYAQVWAEFDAELSPAKGWQVEASTAEDNEVFDYRSKGPLMAVTCEPDDIATMVYVETEASLLDRAQAWFWRLTHPKTHSLR